jgi:hypothetical protein
MFLCLRLSLLLPCVFIWFGCAECDGWMDDGWTKDDSRFEFGGGARDIIQYLNWMRGTREKLNSDGLGGRKFF